MSELTKEKIYKKELEKVGAEGNNNLERIRSLAGGGGETPHLYEIKVVFRDDLVVLSCLSTEYIDNLMNITDDTVITDDIWNNLIKLKDKMYNMHLRTNADTALLGGCEVLFFDDSDTHEINEIGIYTYICYADTETRNYNTSGLESNSIVITKLEDNQGYQVSCEGNRIPRNITCRQIF